MAFDDDLRPSGESFLPDLICLFLGLFCWEPSLTNTEAFIFAVCLAAVLQIPLYTWLDLDFPLLVGLLLLSSQILPKPLMISFVGLYSFVIISFVHGDRYWPQPRLPVGITLYVILTMALVLYVERTAFKLFGFYLFACHRLSHRFPERNKYDEVVWGGITVSFYLILFIYCCVALFM
jgi:hypothetical protein